MPPSEHLHKAPRELLFKTDHKIPGSIREFLQCLAQISQTNALEICDTITVLDCHKTGISFYSCRINSTDAHQSLARTSSMSIEIIRIWRCLALVIKSLADVKVGRLFSLYQQSLKEILPTILNRIDLLPICMVSFVSFCLL